MGLTVGERVETAVERRRSLTGWLRAVRMWKEMRHSSYDINARLGGGLWVGCGLVGNERGKGEEKREEKRGGVCSVGQVEMGLGPGFII